MIAKVSLYRISPCSDRSRDGSVTPLPLPYGQEASVISSQRGPNGSSAESVTIASGWAAVRVGEAKRRTIGRRSPKDYRHPPPLRDSYVLTIVVNAPFPILS